MSDTPRPTDFPALPAFADDKYYTVQLYRAADWAGRHFTASAKLTLRGDIAKEIGDAIFTAEEVGAL